MSHSVLALMILLYSGVSNSVAAKTNLHPYFNPTLEMGNGFTDSPKEEWIPGMRTVLYQVTSKAPDLLTIHVSINDLPRNADFSIKFKYMCSAFNDEHAQSFINPLKVMVKTICTSTIPLRFETQKAGWSSDTNYQLIIKVKTSSTSSSNTSPSTDFAIALRNYVRIQMEFHGKYWSLKSNGLFIRSWDKLSGLINLRTNGRGLLTKEAMDLMRFTNYKGNSGFANEQFLNPDIVRYINSASEFVQSTIGIGAVLEVDGGSCTRTLPELQVAFLSSQHSDAHQFSSSRILRVETSTGKITYSRTALKYLIYRHKHRSSKGWHKRCDNGAMTCQKDAVCTWVEYLPIGKWQTYMHRESLLRFLRPKLEVDTYKWEPFNDCKVVSTKRVTVFARTAVTYVICPIICAYINQPYAFYKGSTRLYPSERIDFKKYGAVYVHKSGTTLQFSEYVTDKDSGEYRCTAGGTEAKFMVDVVSLPMFNIKKTTWVGGELPRVTNPKVGEGYKLNCTVFYTGMRSVTIAPEFYVVSQKTTNTSSKISAIEFDKLLKAYNSSVSISISNNSYSTTLMLTVSKVPAPNNVFNFSHRFVCNAAVSKEDAERFGVSEYNIQSGCQIVVADEGSTNSNSGDVDKGE